MQNAVQQPLQQALAATKGTDLVAATPITGVKTPKNTLLYIIKAGMAKGQMPWQTIAIMSFMSGNTTTELAVRHDCVPRVRLIEDE